MEVKVQIGLGVLALVSELLGKQPGIKFLTALQPSVLATLGLVPGILVISITAAMAFCKLAYSKASKRTG